jgi:hypothetical protein
MTRHPCGCGLAWLTRGGPQDPAETRAPPVFQRHSANERPGWLLCSGHLRLMGLPADLRDPRRSRLPGSVMRAHMRRLRGVFALVLLTACTQQLATGPLPRGWAGPFPCTADVAGADWHRDGVSMLCVQRDGMWQWERILRGGGT